MQNSDIMGLGVGFDRIGWQPLCHSLSPSPHVSRFTTQVGRKLKKYPKGFNSVFIRPMCFWNTRIQDGDAVNPQIVRYGDFWYAIVLGAVKYIVRGPITDQGILWGSYLVAVFD